MRLSNKMSSRSLLYIATKVADVCFHNGTWGHKEQVNVHWVLHFHSVEFLSGFHLCITQKNYIIIFTVNLLALLWSHLVLSPRKKVTSSQPSICSVPSNSHSNKCHFLSALPQVLATTQMSPERLREMCFLTDSSIFYFTFH